MQRGRRRVFVVLGLTLVGTPVAPAAPASAPRPRSEPAPRTEAHTSSLPARLLRIELRCVPVAVAPLPSAPALRPGSVVVGTSGRLDPGPGVTLRSGAAPREAVPLQLLVANGEQARLSLQQSREDWTLDALWLGPAAPTAARASAGAVLRPQRRVSLRQLEVLPRWPGGSQPVQLWVAVLQSAAEPARAGHEPAMPPAGFSVETRVLLPLDRWLPLARVPAAAARPGAGQPPPEQEWQLRVVLVPE